MGFRVQLIAVAGKDVATIQREFGVLQTGKFEELPESPVNGAPLPGGAYLLFINDDEKIDPSASVYGLLSQDASLIACYVNETAMNSYACGWKNGIEQWTVFHDADKAVKHLEIHGQPPPEMQSIRDRLIAMQDQSGGADFVFDIPIELFAALGGIRYDSAIPGAGPTPWEILESV